MIYLINAKLIKEFYDATDHMINNDHKVRVKAIFDF